MKIILIKLILLFTFLSFGQSTEISSSLGLNDSCSLNNSTFQGGETLTYKFYYNWGFIWLSAGEVTFKVTDLGDQFHIDAVGSTYQSYEWFFKVEDRYQAYMDKETLLPNSALREVHEGNYRLYEKMLFNQEGGYVTSTRGKTKKSAEKKNVSISDCVHDVLSIIYYVRNIPFENMSNNQRVPLNVFMDHKTYPLELKYLGREKKKHVRGMGKFNTLRLTPELIAGEVFNEDAQMNIWASDDKNRVPLLIESPVSVGSVKAVLKSYSGLRYNLDSRMD